MPGVDAVHEFSAEVFATLNDAQLANAMNSGVMTDPPDTHEVNGIQYRALVTERYVFGPEAILVSAIRYSMPRQLSDSDEATDLLVEIKTPPPDRDQDHLLRTVSFGPALAYRKRLYVPGIVISTLSTPDELGEALSIARSPHISTPAKLALAQLSEPEEEAFAVWEEGLKERLEEVDRADVLRSLSPRRIPAHVLRRRRR